MQRIPARIWAAEFRASLTLGWPLILTNLSQAALSATDLIIIGRLGAETLAAGSLATSLYHACMIFCMGIASATMPMIATSLGRNRHAVRDVRRTVRQGLWSVALVCLPFWAMLWNVESIYVWLGQRPDVAARSAEFMHTLQWALLPYLGYLVLRSFLAAMQRPFWTLLIAGSAILFNAIAGYGLILGNFGLPQMGLKGAGIVTTCSSLWMFIGLAIVVSTHKRFRRYHLFGRFWRPDWPRFMQLWRIGLPMALTFAFETTIFYAAVVMMGLIGPTALAAHAIAAQISMLSFMVPVGFSQVATVRVGRANGEMDPRGVMRAGWSAYALGVGFMAIMAMIMLLHPQVLVAAFLDLNDPSNAEVASLAMWFLAFAGLFQIVDGAQSIASGMLRGLQDTRVPMLFAALGYWGIGFPLGAMLAFGTDLAGAGVWIGLASGLAVVAVLMTGRWLLRDRLGLLRKHYREVRGHVPEAADALA
ncbi:MATE family efflux transporter [Microvirga subterranea]|uniref:Multidrug-efflux transporter n=1 Tax=Microvirga subterranea TaxID=186651 RepID=A0A370HS00_9HYPH|nr:MATE family efflux transporter [Microvirga subterranea]RDI61080.1 MATE family multidrug resistance protein [Microvirga subterranea]